MDTARVFRGKNATLLAGQKQEVSSSYLKMTDVTLSKRLQPEDTSVCVDFVDMS